MSIFDPLVDAVEAIGDFFKGVWDSIESLFSSKPAGDPNQSCPLHDGALTPEQAQAWMDHFKNSPKDIPFDYPVDCCFTRAREMANELKQAGVPVQKAWNWGDPDKAVLHVPTPNGGNLQPDGTWSADWRYHVAPVVPVRGPDGVVRNMVLDPSMSATPMSVDDWVAAQHTPPGTPPVRITPPDFYVFHPKEMIPKDKNPNNFDFFDPDPGDAAIARTLAEHRAKRTELQNFKETYKDQLQQMRDNWKATH